MKSRMSGPGECFWLRMGEQYSNNSVFTYHFEGRFDQEKLKSALKRLIDSQEYLRVFYRTEHDNIVMFIKDDLPFPYEFKAISGEEEYLDLSEHYRNTPFNESAGRLWLLLHLEYEKDGVVHTKIMCIQNHAIADGESTKILFEQLLSLYQKNNLTLEYVPFKEHFESFFPSVNWLDKIKAIFSFIKFLYVKNKENFLTHPAVDLQGRTPRSIDYAFRLSPEESSRLLAKVKEKKSKAHGIFCAAFLKAFYSLYEVNQRKHIVFSNPVNYRSRLMEDFSRDIAYFIMPVNIQVAMYPEISIWDLADKINKQVGSKMKTPYLNLTKNLLTKVLQKFNSYEKLNDYLTNNSNNFSVISNVGKFPLPEINTKEFELKDISLIPSSQAFLKPGIVFTMVLINGCLRFELVFSEPFVEKAIVERGADLIREYLLEIASS